MALRRKIHQKRVEKKIERVEKKIEEKLQGKQDSFEKYYLFKTEIPIVIRHSFNENIRAKPGSPEIADSKGGSGIFAQFKVHLLENGKFARFQNVKTGKFLRIMGDKVDIGGGVGPFTKFKVLHLSLGHVKLESAQSPGKFIAVTKTGVEVGKGGPWCRLCTLRKGPRDPFSNAYLFALKQDVVIETKFGTHLRITGPKSHDCDPMGGKGPLAHWIIHPKHGGKECQIQNKKTGKYLRIQHYPLRKLWDIDVKGVGGVYCDFIVHTADAANYVRFESKKYKGHFIAVGIGGKKMVVGEGKLRLSLFTVYRD